MPYSHIAFECGAMFARTSDMALIPKSTAGMASHVLTSEVADAIDQICLTGGEFLSDGVV